MKLICSVFIILSLFLVAGISTFAQSWYYPMDSYFERQRLKGFGQFINDDFYKGKEHRFPFNRFYGYHAAVDLEYLPQELEKNIPVYAVTNGKIKYIGELDGYGGVILQDIGLNKTALYGHVKTNDLQYKVGQEARAGEIITYLGDEFSSETSRERKHLHFGVYKGTDLYFKGHEASVDSLNRRWENPTTYLKEKGAILPGSKDDKQKENKNFKKSDTQKFDILNILRAWAKKLFLLP